MKPLYTQEQWDNNEKLAFECYQCKDIFYITRREAKQALNKNNSYEAKFCSQLCSKNNRQKREKVNCAHCQKELIKKTCEIKKTKNHFCSLSCSATYNNTHKTHGTRRSKLEIYLEEKLKFLYPEIHFDFNKKDAINSELDIYIPSFKLAFELNGIYHYEPIHGQEKLAQTQNNDKRKFQACLEKQIELVLIDTSSMINFKEARANKFLTIITEIINQKK